MTQERIDRLEALAEKILQGLQETQQVTQELAEGLQKTQRLMSEGLQEAK